jgi:hypothetical protein
MVMKANGDVAPDNSRVTLDKVMDSGFEFVD